MKKIIYIFSTLLLFIVSVYLANGMYYMEGLTILGKEQAAAGITAAPATEAVSVPITKTTQAAVAATGTVTDGATASASASGTAPPEKPSDKTKYNYFDREIQYHDDYSNEKDALGLSAGTSYVIDKLGNKMAIPPSGSGTPITYFKPEQYVYGSLSYVPNYEDSVYLSRTANMYIGKPIVETSSVKGGICNFYKNNPSELENACRNTDPNVCASTSCCVLLGGAKCVSGSDKGPTMKSNYSDVSIPNRDFYYYQSKCYGNCPVE